MTRFAIVVVLAGCGGRLDVEGFDAASDAKTDVTKKDAASKLDAALADASALVPICSAPSTPSNGACGNFDCNPITNSPCDGGAGEACDVSSNGFQCYPPPPTNTAKLCEACDDQSVACLPGSTCLTTNQPSTCAKFCCDDGDCGGGHCNTLALGLAPIGVCVQ